MGKVTFGVIETPGHTVESVSYLLTNAMILEAIFTGDTLLLGSIGAPDITILEHYNKSVDKSQGHSEYSRKDLCDMLYNSIYNKFFFMPTETVIYPGHGQQTPHVKYARENGNPTKTFIVEERMNNPFLKFRKNKEAFFNFIFKMQSVVDPRSYCDNVAKLNILGYESFKDSMSSFKKEIDIQNMENVILSNSNNIISHAKVEITHSEMEETKFVNKVALIDTRNSEKSIAEHLPGSILINLKCPFSIWTGTLISHQTDLIIITEPGKENKALSALIRIGYYNVKGYFTQVTELVNKLKGNSSYKLLSSVSNIAAEVVPKFLYNSNYKLLDVREKVEFEEGSFSHSINYPLSRLEEKETRVNSQNIFRQIPKDEDLYVFCRTGVRSLMAVSILQGMGYTKLHNLFGGVLKIQERGIELTKNSQ